MLPPDRARRVVRAAARSLAGQGSAPTQPETRFVRLEKKSYPQDIQAAREAKSDYRIEAQAMVQLRREKARAEGFRKDFREQLAHRAQAEQARLQNNLKIAAQGDAQQQRALIKNHTKSNHGSPYLSGTPSFNSDPQGQLGYVLENLKRAEPVVITVHRTSRASPNPHNVREKELLLPVGERLDELQASLHVEKSARGVAVHLIEHGPAGRRVHTGGRALALFQALAIRDEGQIRQEAAPDQSGERANNPT